MKAHRNRSEGTSVDWNHGYPRPLSGMRLAVVVLGAILGVVVGSVFAGEPRIVGIEHRGAEFLIRVNVPPGVARVVIEGSRREDLRTWIPKATAQVAPHESELIFSLEADARMEMFRVRAEANDPLPAGWYAGPTVFPAEPSGDPWLVLRETAEEVTGVSGQGWPRDVFESDLWAPRGDTLLYFNELRGLQRIDLTDPAFPKLLGTLALPGSGEQMYLAGNDHVVLLMRDPCGPGGTEAESVVRVVDTSAVPLVEVARMPLRGRIVESRWVGAALYVATETWEPLDDGSGSWRSGTQVASFDFSVPQAPAPRGTIWFPGSGNVVSATDRFLFVAVTDYSRPWPWKSDLEILDITAADGSMATAFRLPLAGRIQDKFKIDVLGDTLRLVMEAVESPESTRRVTTLESYRLADPFLASPLPVMFLDRLELARGERLFSTRFEGALAYVVTFDRTDPLWVVDLSDPADLRVAGELEVPGWSTFIHPMGDRLLTLGVDDVQGRRVAVRLFDVSNPAQPGLLSEVHLGEDISWNEANSDEKAFGVFPENGLVLVPVSEGSRGYLAHGVHLLDLGRDVVTLRGFLTGESVVPRRVLLHRDRLLTLSSRALVSAEIGDRDEPTVTSSVELAYPVERVLAVGDHLLEFQNESVRIRSRSPNGSEPGILVALGDLPVLGAFARDGLLHVLQGRRAEVVWEHDDGMATWNVWTNSGALVASVWDATALPRLTRLGEARHPTGQGAIGVAEGFALEDGWLLWSSTSDGSHSGLPMGAADGGRSLDRLAAGSGGAWRPWRENRARTLLAVDVRDPRAPAIRSEFAPSPSQDSASVGEIVPVGGLVFSTRRTTESEVVGTNRVVEMAWFPARPRVETNAVTVADGGSMTHWVARNEGVWRSVTNAYPILRWWSRYELDVVDYREDPAMPAVRMPVPVPGELVGVARDGALVLTSGWVATSEGNQVAMLDAGAYDGTAVHRIASVPIADARLSETCAVAERGGVVHVARGGWGPAAVQRVESWSLGEDGAWVQGPDVVVGLGNPPLDLKWFGDLLLARTSAGVEVLGPGGNSALEMLSSGGIPGCIGADLERGDGDAGGGVWLPLGEYGSVRLGP